MISKSHLVNFKKKLKVYGVSVSHGVWLCFIFMFVGDFVIQALAHLGLEVYNRIAGTKLILDILEANPYVFELERLFSSLITLSIFVLHYQANIRSHSTIRISDILWVTVAVLALFVPVEWMVEHMGFQVEQDIVSVLTSIIYNPFGLVDLCIIGPFVEEVAFRATIEDRILKRGVNPYVAIFMSSLLFGVMHLNASQIVYAFCIGYFLGWIYYKKRSLWLCVIAHSINNGTDVIISRITHVNYNLSDIFSSYPHILYMMIVLSCVMFLLSLRYLVTIIK